MSDKKWNGTTGEWRFTTSHKGDKHSRVESIEVGAVQEWTENEYGRSRTVLDVVQIMNDDRIDVEETKCNLRLLADAGNTIQKCDLLPSELLERLNEAVKELSRVRLDIKLTGAFKMDSPIVQGMDRIIKKHEG